MAGVGAGIFYLCGRLGLGTRIAGVSAALFAVLPIHAEAVAWISSRFDLLATTCMVWAAALYLRYRFQGGSGWFAMASCLAVLAMFSKESAFALPLLLLLAETIFFRPIRWKPLCVLFAVAAGVFFYRWYLLGGLGGYMDATGQSTAMTFKLTMLQGLFVRAPALLSIGLNWRQPPSIVPVVLAALLGGALTALSLGAKADRNTGALIRFCLGWILVSLLPAHFLLLIGPELTNSRVLYPASAGMAILLAILLHNIPARRLRVFLTALFIVCFGLGALHNQAAWRYGAEAGRRFLGEIRRVEPDPPPGATFIIRNMPESIRGVFFFREGLSRAIQYEYRRLDLDARREESCRPGEIPVIPDKPKILMSFTGPDRSPMVSPVKPDR